MSFEVFAALVVSSMKSTGKAQEYDTFTVRFQQDKHTTQAAQL